MTRLPTGPGSRERFVGWLLRRPARRPFDPYDYGYPRENPVHRLMWPDCYEPLPHGHDLRDLP